MAGLGDWAALRGWLAGVFGVVGCGGWLAVWAGWLGGLAVLAGWAGWLAALAGCAGWLAALAALAGWLRWLAGCCRSDVRDFSHITERSSHLLEAAPETFLLLEWAGWLPKSDVGELSHITKT